jgi:HD superfamily phosphohydrolase
MADLVSVYRQRIEELGEILLRPYLSRLGDTSLSSKLRSKEINDAVWQTIVLTPLEVLILDSPLLQRLRRIRQLGVVHWTYPCALHTRLEHSIGAVLQVQRLIDSMNLHSAGERLPIELVNVLRLTALCHDIGHGLMSHVSENALRQNAGVERLRFELRKALKRKCSLSEAAAYFLIGSPPFQELIRLALEKTNHQDRLPENPSQVMQDAVLGKVVDGRYPLIQELISGPYDADKLDYMTRDAYATGIPTVTDIPRLVQKVRMVPVARDELPRCIAETVPKQNLYYVNAVALSGARTLDELMLARTLLFDKVYRHHKVRAAEAMVAVMIAQLAILLGDRAALLPLLLDDDDLLQISRPMLEEKLHVTIKESDWENCGAMRDLSKRLRDRNLFVRAYAFSPYLPHDPFKHEPNRGAQHELVAREMEQAETRTVLLDEIVAQVLRMRLLLQGRIAQALSDEEVAGLISLDLPPPSGETSPIARAYLVRSDQTLMPFREDSPESSPWSNAYILARDLGYVFSAPELADAVFLASEFIFRSRYQLRTPESSLEYAKVDRGRVEQLRQQLTNADYYESYPNDLRSQPARMKVADVDAIIEQVVQKLGLFEGLSLEKDEKVVAIRIDSDRVRAWLRQFRTDAEVEGALGILRAIRMISRNELHDAVVTFMNRHPDFKSAFVCPYGSPKDSSHHLTYYVEDVAERYNFQLAMLSEALSGDPHPILFIDDFVGSGQQAETVLLGWLGHQEDAPLEEHHGAPLSQILREELKKRKLGFVFVAGNEAGANQLINRCRSFGISAESHIEIPAGQLPRAFVGNAIKFEDDAARETFEATCARIGRELLTTGTTRRHSEEWVRDRELGYGNSGYLVAFPYNVPTQTLTLLWHAGTANGGSWMPLLPRRKKN